MVKRIIDLQMSQDLFMQKNLALEKNENLKIYIYMHLDVI